MATTIQLKAEGIGGEGSVARAADLLRRGATVAFPTETVYGLGANALDPAAVAKIFEAKGRPAWDPLIVHIDAPEMLPRVAAPLEPALQQRVLALTQAFWPGPLTLLLPRASGLPDAVTAGRELVGVRMPAHPVARELIRLAQVPVAAPSANRFGHTSPTTAAHVLADLDGRIDAVIDAGPARVGLESTVFDLGTLRIYRPGAVTAEMLVSVLRARVELLPEQDLAPGSEARVSPGLGLRHYAPTARLVLVEGQEQMTAETTKALAFHEPNHVGVMLPDGWSPAGAGAIFRWGPWENAEVLARLVFFGLRLLDSRGVKVIVCPLPSAGGIGDAIRDRLTKAAKPA